MKISALFQFNTFFNPGILQLRNVIFLAACLLISSLLKGQTTWTGSGDADWSNAANWTAGVPDALDDVTIPDVATDPVISSSALAKSVTINSGAVLTITSAGTITINGSTMQGILNNGTIDNAGIMILGSTSNIGQTGIRNNGVINNQNGASITINRSLGRAIHNYSGTFTNRGTITLGSTNSVGFEGINNRSVFDHVAGLIKIDRSAAYGLFCDTAGIFTNSAVLTIGSLLPVSNLLAGEGSFINNTGGVLNGTGFIPGKIFANAGGTLSPGYSPGKMTFFGRVDFNNSISNIEVNGKGLAGVDFDQIVVSDTATLGGTLALSINFPSAVDGDEIPVLASNGIKDTFDVITGLEPNWFIIYRNTGAVLRYGALTETVWIGDSSTVWSDPDNWSNGVPTSLSDVSINDTSTYYPVLTGTGLAKSIQIKAGGTLTISASGILNIQGSNEQAIKNEGTVINNGSINIGTSTGSGFIGIHNAATFNNNAGAQIKIDRSTYYGLYNAGGTFTNAAQLDIGGIASPGNNGIWNAATFDNISGGQIKIDGTSDGGIFNDTLAIFTNDAASIIIGSASPVGGYGIRNKFIFNNNSGGEIAIDRTNNYAIYHTFNTFSNSGTITLGAAANIGDYGLNIISTFNNNTDGQINIDRAVQAGIIIYSSTFANQGTITIGALVPMINLITGTSGNFNNSTGGLLKGSGNVAAGIFANAGGTLSPGYSPGLMTFTAGENFANSTLLIEVNGNGTAGVDYDRLSVAGTATLGGDLTLSFAYGGVPGDQIRILTASSVSGTFASVTGLPSGWTLDYSATAVTLTYITAGSTTWTGAVDESWNVAGNWSSGVPIASSDVIIPDVSTHDPVIAASVSVKSLIVNEDAALSITSAGTLTINGAASQALLNNGSVANNGTIHIGSASSVGANGLKNNGTFTNNTGAQVNINRAVASALENAGTFINLATITIGGITNAGANGLLNTSQFDNRMGGLILVDRTGTTGVYNNTGGTFDNTGTLTIGSAFGAGEYGILNKATFNNNPGSQLSINRSTESGIENQGTFTNTVTINIGNIASPGNNGIRNTSVFNHNAGAILNIDRTTDAGVNNDLGGIFDNQGSMLIGASQDAGQYGLWNSAVFTNTGTISIDRTTFYGLWNYLGTFTNHSAINIGSAANIGNYALYNNALFDNSSGGNISIMRSSQAGIYNYGAGTMNNSSTMTIGASQSVGAYGIINLSFFNNNSGVIHIDNCTNSGIYNDNETFTNLASINIGSNASIGSYGVRNRNIFNNDGGQININRASDSGIYIEAGTLANQAIFVIGQLVAATDLIKGVSGSFDNNTGGTIKGSGNVASAYFSNGGGKIAPGYSPGIMTFTGAMDFNNSIVSVEVNGKASPGTDFDRVVVSGAATLGGVLEVVNNFPGAVAGDQVTILTATSVTGTFENITGLPANWSVSYTPTSVILALGPPLPVELIHFKAAVRDKAVRLEWQTASETNNRGFEIERSPEGKTWSKIGFVAGKGTTTTMESYAFVDYDAVSGINAEASTSVYYRLRQLDINGKENLSRIEVVDISRFGNLYDLINVFPNPVVNRQLTVSANNVSDHTTYARLLNVSGSDQQTWELKAGKNTLDLGNIMPGIYILQVFNEKEYLNLKIVVPD